MKVEYTCNSRINENDEITFTRALDKPLISITMHVGGELPRMVQISVKDLQKISATLCKEGF